MAITKNTGDYPRIYSCSDTVSGVTFVDINYAVLGLVSPPAINAMTSIDVNVFLSDVTASTAKINFSHTFVGTVYYTVIGYK